ncbi:MAG: hypothetical protein QGG40_08130, partial [Myxococcota bacterium]|nr:hypothetical protein [Myxococcota bacterium]
GTDMRTWVERGEDASDPEDACLLQTPEWDFDWQQFYFYDVDGDNAPKMYGGDEIWLQCTYDNSTANPGLLDALEESGLDAPVDVFLGDGTLDEMCIGVFGMVLDVEFETDNETHTGELDGTVSVLGLDVACEGMSSLSVTDEQVTGLARCGLEIVGGLYTFEMDLSGDIVDGQITGTATFGVVGLSETFDLDLSGTSSDGGIDLHSEGSGSMDGYEIDVSMEVVAP